MTDEPMSPDPSAEVPDPDAPESTAPADLAPTPVDEEQRRRRDARGLAGAIIVVVIIIVAFMLLRSCGGGSEGLDGRGNKTIERVEGAEPVPGSVSVWISGEVPISEVLRDADVNASDLLSLGGGRYIIQVSRGAEVNAATRIAEQQGVYDAGLVYEVDEAP